MYLWMVDKINFFLRWFKIGREIHTGQVNYYGEKAASNCFKDTFEVCLGDIMSFSQSTFKDLDHLKSVLSELKVES